MGYYINTLPDGTRLPNLGKAEALLTAIPNSEQISKPIEWHEDIVCVVNNGLFEAAAYCYSAHELEVFAEPDGRPKTWLRIPDAKSIAK